MKRRMAKHKPGNLAAVVNSVPGEKVVMAHSLGAVAASSAFVDHGMVADKYFALNAAVASEAFDSTLFNTSTNNPLVHVYWHDYLPRTWSACWHELFPAGDDRRKLTWKDRFAAVGTHTTMYNDWSSGDEVLELGKSGLSFRSYDGSALQYTWHKQELLKGRRFFCNNDWSGWGFEAEDGASVANSAATNVLRSTPFFNHNPEGMFTNSIPETLQNHILAKGIPALSAPVGRTELANIISERNKNMNDMKPRSGLWYRMHDYYEDRWLHNDIQDVGYFYTHEVFNSFVVEGDLK